MTLWAAWAVACVIGFSGCAMSACSPYQNEADRLTDFLHKERVVISRVVTPCAHCTPAMFSLTRTERAKRLSPRDAAIYDGVENDFVAAVRRVFRPSQSGSFDVAIVRDGWRLLTVQVKPGGNVKSIGGEPGST